MKLWKVTSIPWRVEFKNIYKCELKAEQMLTDDVSFMTDDTLFFFDLKRQIWLSNYKY